MKTTILVIIQLIAITNAFVIYPKTKPFSQIQKQIKLSSEPNESELKQQQKETFKSLENYHYGLWNGISKSFSVALSSEKITIDDYKDSMEYTTSVQILQDKIQETISWDNQQYVKTRDIILDSTVDIDSVDSSYSYDFDSQNIPSVFLGNEIEYNYGIEYCTVTSENNRIRSFLLYNGSDDKKEISRIIVCSETRSETKMQEEEELQSYPITIFGLVSGAWLGDVIIRNHCFISQPKGFSTPKLSKFANWSLGVQKISNYYTISTSLFKIKEKLTLGRYIGSTLDNNHPLLSIGTYKIYRAPNKITCINYDDDSIGLLFDNVFIKLPFIINNHEDEEEENVSMSQVTIYQKKQKDNQSIIEDSTINTMNDYIQNTEISCSSLSRMYKNGSLYQGTSSFFVLDRSVMLDDDCNDDISSLDSSSILL